MVSSVTWACSEARTRWVFARSARNVESRSAACASGNGDFVEARPFVGVAVRSGKAGDAGVEPAGPKARACAAAAVRSASFVSSQINTADGGSSDEVDAYKRLCRACESVRGHRVHQEQLSTAPASRRSWHEQVAASVS